MHNFSQQLCFLEMSYLNKNIQFYGRNKYVSNLNPDFSFRLNKKTEFFFMNQYLTGGKYQYTVKIGWSVFGSLSWILRYFDCFKLSFLRVSFIPFFYIHHWYFIGKPHFWTPTEHLKMKFNRTFFWFVLVWFYVR